MKDGTATLQIDTWSSLCRNCGKGADPSAKTHDFEYGYFKESGKRPGCGIEWTHVSSGYTDFEGLYEGIRKMRPDLIFIDSFEGINNHMRGKL